ncbi:MAG: hypothetical protein GF365_00695 [Candidatus Buchananbacteria bacterium]|nr:hypothetical protein [Candidatus Buchananbacteria bacterium]
MTQKIKIITLIIVMIILIVGGLLLYYFKPAPSINLPPPVEEEENLQTRLENVVDFGFVSSPYTLDSILESSEYQQIKQEVHDICYDDKGNLGLYFSCLRAFDTFAANKINNQLLNLNQTDQQDLLTNLYEIDERYGVPSLDIRTPEMIFRTREGQELVNYFEENASLEDFNFTNNINEIFQRQSFKEWLDDFHAKKRELCYFPPETDIARDCDSFTTPYASTIVINFLYPERQEEEVLSLVGVLERGIYKSDEDLLEIYNNLLSRYYNDFLDNYVQEMKNKYPILASGQVTDLNTINDFLLDPNDSLIYQVGKLYYYVNYLHVGSKGKVRDKLNQNLNDKFAEVAADLGIDNDDLKQYLIAIIGDEEEVIDQLVSQYRNLKVNYPANVNKLEINPTFIFWESMVEDQYYNYFTDDFNNIDAYYDDLRTYRLYTYLLLYYSDDYKSTTNRQDAFAERGEDGGQMQNVFKFSRYIERDELDELMNYYNKERGTIIDLSEGH